MSQINKLATLVKFFALVLLVLYASCVLLTDKHITELSGQVMTINYRILIGQTLSDRQRQAVLAIINGTFAEINAIFNKWNPTSEISLLNALPAHIKQPLSPALYQFLQRLDSYVTLSGGKFDPTMEPLQQLWKKYLSKGVIPPENEIAQIRPSIGWHNIHFENGWFYKDDDRTALDLGGVAKGLCVDLILERLHMAGYPSLFVEWGGEIRTCGYHPSKRPWQVYISRLGELDEQKAIAQLNLTDQALATSGDYFQYWLITMPDSTERTFCHIFNPKTLWPLEVRPGSVNSSSMLAHDCVTADALAKVPMLFDTVDEATAWLQKVQQIYPEVACWIVAHQNQQAQ